MPLARNLTRREKKAQNLSLTDFEKFKLGLKNIAKKRYESKNFTFMKKKKMTLNRM